MGCMFRGPVPAPVTLDLANTPTNLDLERYAESCRVPGRIREAVLKHGDCSAPRMC